jgi:uncharacterized protein (DUF779 family)
MDRPRRPEDQLEGIFAASCACHATPVGHLDVTLPPCLGRKCAVLGGSAKEQVVDLDLGTIDGFPLYIDNHAYDRDQRLDLDVKQAANASEVSKKATKVRRSNYREQAR